MSKLGRAVLALKDGSLHSPCGAGHSAATPSSHSPRDDPPHAPFHPDAEIRGSHPKRPLLASVSRQAAGDLAAACWPRLCGRLGRTILALEMVLRPTKIKPFNGLRSGESRPCQPTPSRAR